jgi:hypothetical protein
LAALDEALARAAERVVPACRTGGRWQERIMAGFGALLEFIDEQPFMGRLLLVESLVAGPGSGAASERLSRRSLRSILHTRMLERQMAETSAGGASADANDWRRASGRREGRGVGMFIELHGQGPSLLQA